MEQQLQPKKKSKIGKIVLYVFLGFISICVLSFIFSDNKEAAAKTDGVSKTEIAETSQQDPELEKIRIKLKSKAEKDWPNDFSTQEYWINQELEDYDFMKSVEDGELKRKAQQDWPNDFTTQKYWYNTQIEAKERLAK